MCNECDQPLILCTCIPGDRDSTNKLQGVVHYQIDPNASCCDEQNINRADLADTCVNVQLSDSAVSNTNTQTTIHVLSLIHI